MTILVPRRSVLSSLAAIPAVLMLAACSDSTQQAKAEEQKPVEGAQPTQPKVEAPKPAGTVDAAKLLQAGSLADKSLGKDDAPVTIVEYASMTCPHCARFHETTLPELTSKYIDTGKVRLILREFPFDPRAEAGFMLARCSESNYFPMIDTLFKQQDAWAGVENAREALMRISKLAGFSQESFEACLTNQKLLDDIRAVRTRGAGDLKVDSTPTFFINGNVYKGSKTIEEMSAIIDGML